MSNPKQPAPLSKETVETKSTFVIDDVAGETLYFDDEEPKQEEKLPVTLFSLYLRKTQFVLLSKRPNMAQRGFWEREEWERYIVPPIPCFIEMLPSKRCFERQTSLLLLEEVYEGSTDHRAVHPSIVPVYGLTFDEAQQPSLIMKKIDGQTLSSYIERCNRSSNESNNLKARLDLLLKSLPFLCSVARVLYIETSNQKILWLVLLTGDCHGLGNRKNS